MEEEEDTNTNTSDQSSKLVEFLGDSFRKSVLSVLSIGPVPAHIAFIMDGNRRYAKKLRLLDGDGHKAGYSALLNMLKYCYELGVNYVTIYAFSIDNFKRRPDEVETTLKLIEDKIEQLVREETMLNFFGVRIYFLGNLTLLSESVRLAAQNAMAATAGNSQVVLSVCLAYTSKDEIVHAVEQTCIEKWDGISPLMKRNGTTYDSILAGENVADGKEEAGTGTSTINVADVEKHMYASIAPDPDIIVRTSGETRLSNFLLWQSSNCLLYSPSAFWPEIRFRHLVWAVLEFQRNFSDLKQQKTKNPQVSNSSHPFLWIAFLGITTQILGFYSTGLFLWIRLVIYILVLVKLAKTFYSLRLLRKSRKKRGKGEGKMVVRLRLSRFGCKNKPFYRVMAADSRSPRDGKHLEVLGYYNPLPGQDGGKRMGLNFDRVKYWLSVGAQPSEPVQRLLFRGGLLPPPPMTAMGRKGGPRDTRPVDPMTGRVLTEKSPKNVGPDSGNEVSEIENTASVC